MNASTRFSNPIFAVIILMGFLSGCSSLAKLAGGKKGALLVLFVETTSRDPDLVRRIEWHMENPREAFVEKEPIMEPLAILDKAKLHNLQDGSHVVELIFNDRGAHYLEAISIEQRTRRIFLVAFYQQKKDDTEMTARCIGVHVLENINRTGRLYFTPDITGDEAERLIDSFNKTAKGIQR